METSEQKKVIKQAPKKPNSTALRVSNETRKKVLTELSKANRKAFGKKIKCDALIARAITKLTAQDILELQEQSLSNEDRFEQRLRDYISKHGQITRDEFLGKVLGGEVAKVSHETVTKSEGIFASK